MDRTARLLCAVGVIALTPFAADAKDRRKAEPPQDQIEVVGRTPLGNGPIISFLMTQHYRRNYLYVQGESGKSVALIDVTDVKAPTVLQSVTASTIGKTEIVAAAGTAALVNDGGYTSTPVANPQTFRIMSFADPLHPVVKQEFANVSAIARDDKRGLIFLASPQGVWILQQKLAMDPAFEKEWEHMMLDNR